MRLMRSLLTSGLLAAWLALAALIASPVIGAAQAQDAAALAGWSDATICGEHGDDSAPDHHAMAGCAICLCCAPILVVLPPPPLAPGPSRVTVAAIAVPLAQHALRRASVEAAYPRGPPASI